MRRSDREIIDPVAIRRVFVDCTSVRLAFCDGSRPYIVPLSYGFSEENGQYTLYFHGAGEGRKAELIEKTGYAAFQMDCGYALHTSEAACSHSAAFRSIFGEGTVERISDPEEAALALNAIMCHTAGRDGWTFPPERLQKTAVWKLSVKELSCKEHK